MTEILENSKSAKQVYEFLNKSKKDNTNGVNGEFDFEDVNDFYRPHKKSKIDSNTEAEVAPSTSKAASKAAAATTNKKSLLKPFGANKNKKPSNKKKA